MPSVRLSVNISELKLAYKRVKNDRPHRCFVAYPYMLSWAEINFHEWLEELKDRLSSGFQPHSSRLCWVPKPYTLLRPANILHLKDELVYNLLIGRLFKQIHSSLESFQGEPDAAYILSSPDKNDWIQNNFSSWQKFRGNSLRNLKNGTKFVVVSDITGYYENIDVEKLLSDLRQIIGGTLPEIDLLRLCLRKWSERGNKGIPQGYSASDILSKVYANSIDIALQNEGYTHLRYVDDIRIFCESKNMAKRAIFDLSKYVHKRGLNLQSAKTEILPLGEAKLKFDGVKPIVDSIHEELIEEIRDEIEQEGPYPNIKHLNQLLRVRKELPSEVLERTFKEYFIDSGPNMFDKTLFHFLLVRLARANSKIAVDYCLDTLEGRPEESEYILSYFTDIGLSENHIKSITKYLTSKASIYDYQCYQILKWFFDQKLENDDILVYCRSITRDQNKDVWLRSYATAYLGRHGNIPDLQSFESLYNHCSNDLERADCIMALSRIEVGHRNAFYSSVENDSPLVKRAVKLAKNMSH